MENLSLLPPDRWVGALEELLSTFDYLEPDSSPLPDCIANLPPFVADFYRLASRCIVLHGSQDFLHDPPLKESECRWQLIRENQGGFTFSIEQDENQRWVPKHSVIEDALIPSIEGYLVSFALQEIVFGARLWLTDEGAGSFADLETDCSLIWDDALMGGYTRPDLTTFHQHENGSIIMQNKRGFGDVGCHDRSLEPYFETKGFYNMIG